MIEEKIAIFGKAEGYVITAIVISAGATVLLCFGKVDPATWAQVVQWTWMSVCGGGAVAAFRSR